MAQNLRPIQSDVKNFHVQHMGHGGSAITTPLDDTGAVIDAICAAVDAGEITVMGVHNLDVLRHLARPMVARQVRLTNAQYNPGQNAVVHMPMHGQTAHMLANLASVRRGTTTHYTRGGVHTHAQHTQELDALAGALGGVPGAPNRGLFAMQEVLALSHDLAIHYAGQAGQRAGRRALLDQSARGLRDALVETLGNTAAIDLQITNLNNTIAARDATIAIRDGTIDNQATTIAARNATIAAQTITLNTQAAALQNLNGLQQELTNLRNTIANLQAPVNRDLGFGTGGRNGRDSGTGGSGRRPNNVSGG